MHDDLHTILVGWTFGDVVCWGSRCTGSLGWGLEGWRFAESLTSDVHLQQVKSILNPVLFFCYFFWSLTRLGLREFAVTSLLGTKSCTLWQTACGCWQTSPKGIPSWPCPWNVHSSCHITLVVLHKVHNSLLIWVCEVDVCHVPLLVPRVRLRCACLCSSLCIYFCVTSVCSCMLFSAECLVSSLCFCASSHLSFPRRLTPPYVSSHIP